LNIFSDFIISEYCVPLSTTLKSWLLTHLTAVSYYEEQEQTEKMIRHMIGFKDILNHQLNNDLISEEAFNVLNAQADDLIEKWQ